MIYARKGERIFCENGHEICTVKKDIKFYDTSKGDELYKWRQKEPKRGDKIPVCFICNSDFYMNNTYPYNPDQSSPKYHPGIHLHFEDGWR